MILRDWCDLPADLLATLYETERRRWLQMLQWDSGPAWQEIEHARVTWGLPGFAALDPGGRVRGVAYYLLEQDRIDIGSIASESDAATDVLLDGILTVADALDLSLVRTLSLDTAVALKSGLRVRGFEIEPHLYLSRAVTQAEVLSADGHGLWGRLLHYAAPPAPATPVQTHQWLPDDVEPAAALLARAYDRRTGRLFAPNGEAGEWSRYMRNLVSHVGCGALNPAATQVLRDGENLHGLAMITNIGARVAHLAQLAVDPARRGSQIGATLLRQACAVLQQADFTTLTLMVAGDNASARALYDRAGFRHDATFLAGTLDVRATRRARSAPPALSAAS